MSNFNFFVSGRTADGLSERGAAFTAEPLLEADDLLDEAFFDLTKIFIKYTSQIRARFLFI